MKDTSSYLTDYNLLPQSLQEKSLSNREVVLPYKETLRAITIFVQSKLGILDWEGWAKYPHGTGHFSEYWGIDLEPKPEEVWDEFVNRAASQCCQTIAEAQEIFETSGPDPKGRQLYFCVTAVSLAQFNELTEDHGNTRKSKK